MPKATFTWLKLLVALAGLLVIGGAFRASRSGSAISQLGTCTDLLPVEILRILNEQFSGWHIQKSEALSTTARERWQSEKPLACPGIASGEFTGKNMSYAVLVVRGDGNKSEGRLLAFIRNSDRSTYGVQVMEEIQVGAINYFIHKIDVHRLFDTGSIRRFRVAAKDGPVLFDAGKEEYGTEVYF
jgi:hypothetical protein